MRTFLKATVALLLIGIAALLSWVFTSTYQPRPVQKEEVVSAADLAPLQPGQTLKVLNWNVQFLAGNANNRFFYDGGTDPWPAREVVEEVGRKIVAFIKAESPDVVLLQEIDQGADRTYLLDQQAMLLDSLPEYRAHAATFYWKADYVPHPDIAGKVGLKLLVLSRYPISDAKRYALPSISTDDFITRQFNLKRALLEVSLPVAGSRDLKIINTHLSAFAQGSDTMARQIAMIDEYLQILEAAGDPWILAGDFNLLPDTDAYARLPARYQANYNAEGSEMEPLLKYPMVPPLASMQSDDYANWFTYMPADDSERKPNRTIDYLLYSEKLVLTDAAVLRGDALSLSDHLPVAATLKLPK